MLAVRAGVRIRIMLADPDGAAVAVRAAEEGVGDLLQARVRSSWLVARKLRAVPGVQLLSHDTTLCASILRADDDLLVNTHAFGLPAAAAPVLSVNRRSATRVAET